MFGSGPFGALPFGEHSAAVASPGAVAVHEAGTGVDTVTITFTTSRAASLGAEVVFISLSPPAPTDDARTIGARVGNRWHDQTEDVFWLCSNAAVGAAVWRKLARAGSDADRPPLGAFLGSAAYADVDMLRARRLNQEDAAYQMVLQDWGKLLLCTAGTRTWTLPSYLDLPNGWWTCYKNRSGNNLTLAPTGSELLNGANANVTVATGGSGVLTMTGAGFETH